jgi:pimeloyl-ACP methyl ester carboxylesterase
MLTGSGISGSSGSTFFGPLATPGTYEFRLFANGLKVATSNPFYVPALTASPTTVPAGQLVTASWSSYAPTGTDWISLHAVGAPNSVYLDVHTITGGAGSTTFTAPATPGTYEFRLFGIRSGTQEQYATSNAFQVSSDTTPPTTTAAAVAGGSPYTFGSWTNQNVSMTLSATDNVGGSGVERIFYANNDPLCTPANAFTHCFSAAGSTLTLTFTAEGTVNEYFFSKDSAGNFEAQQSRVIKIDKSAPTTTAAATTADGNPYTFGTPTTQTVTVRLSATDNPSAVTNAGVATTYYAVDDATCAPATLGTCIGASPPVTASASISWTRFGTHTVYFFSVDGAGNTEGQQSVQVVIAAPPVQLTLLPVEHFQYPLNTLVQVPNSGTVDGNTIAVPATVNNTGSTDIVADVLLFDAETKAILVSLPGEFLPANFSKRYEFDKDTQGWAWNPNGTPHAAPRTIGIQLRAADGTVLATQTTQLLVRPKPVILVHGWAADYGIWNYYLGDAGFVRQAHPNWHAYSVGDGQVRGTMNTGLQSDPFAPTNTLSGNAKILHSYIEGVRRKENAWHVDLVAHSMGGLISRQYIQDFMGDSPDGRPVVGRLLQIGTPNAGSPCADELANTSLLTNRNLLNLLLFLLPPPLNIITSVFTTANIVTTIKVPFSPATYELTPASMQTFNSRVTEQRDVPFWIIAGNSKDAECFHAGTGDGIVPLASALGPPPTFVATATTPYEHTAQYGAPPGDISTARAIFRGFVWPDLAQGPTPGGLGTVAFTYPSASSLAGAAMQLQLAAPAADGYVAAADSRADDAARWDELSGIASGAATTSAAPPPSLPPAPQLLFADGGQLDAGTSLDVPIPVTAGSVLEVMLQAPAAVRSTLYDLLGAMAGSAATTNLIQSYRVRNPASGTWQLHLTNPGPDAAAVTVGAAVQGDPFALTLTVGQPGTDGRVPLTATFTKNGTPVTGATVLAIVRGSGGSVMVVPLHGGTQQGIYRGTTDVLAPDSYAIGVRAATPDATRMTLGLVQIPTSYRLTLTPAGNGTATASPAGPTYPAGTRVTLQATPAAGATFLGWTVDGGWRTANPLTIVMNGGRAVTADFATAGSKADTTPPTTTAVLSPGPNAAGWNNSAVTVLLQATDNFGGSGVKQITYSASGGQALAATTVAGESAEVVITAEGTTTLTYAAIDQAGNREAAKTVTVKPDKTPPTVTFAGNAGTYTVDQTVSITCTATDPPGGSGLASQICPPISGPAYTFPLGGNTFFGSAVDVAGNAGRGTVSLTVTVTYDSLCNLSKQFVTNAGIARSNDLCAQLNAAQAAASRGDLTAKANALGAYDHAVDAGVNGGWLTADKAAILKKLAAVL